MGRAGKQDESEKEDGEEQKTQHRDPDKRKSLKREKIDLYPAGKPPSHPKNRREEEDLQKYIKISSPFTAREKWAHALDLVVSTLK